MMSGGRDDHEAAGMEQDGVPAPAAVSAKKLWRMVRAAYLVVGKKLGKHQPKLAALSDHLLSRRPHHCYHDGGGGGLVAAAREHPALAYLSCWSMDPATAVVHPYRPRGAHGSRDGASSLSCRSVDAVEQYRPREVEFSCRSTPPHTRRQRAQYRRPGVHPPRQVRTADSPFLAREEEDAVVDRRADEFITWFHEQLRMQQQRPAAAHHDVLG